MSRRIVSCWFPRLASERVLRRRGLAHGHAGVFAVLRPVRGADRLHCLTAAAEAAGLTRGMAAADARAICPDLVTAPSDPLEEARFLARLQRWSQRWSPHVGASGDDGLALDVTGVAHLFGGEPDLLADVETGFIHIGLTVRVALADTAGAAWALSRFRATGSAPARTATPPRERVPS